MIHARLHGARSILLCLLLLSSMSCDLLLASSNQQLLSLLLVRLLCRAGRVCRQALAGVGPLELGAGAVLLLLRDHVHLVEVRLLAEAPA